MSRSETLEPDPDYTGVGIGVAMFILFVSLLMRAQDVVTNTPSVLVEAKKINGSTSLQQTTSSKTSSEDSLSEMANLNFAGGTNRLRFLQVRGLGETSSTQPTTPSSSVGVRINNMDLTGLLTAWPQLGVSEISLQSGPQSLQQGGWSSAGTLDLQLQTVATPQSQWTIGSWQEQQITALIPIMSKSTLLIGHHQRNGFYQNSYLNKPGNAQNEFFSSFHKEWLSTSAIHLKTSHLFHRGKNAYDVWSLNKSFTTTTDHPGVDNLNVHAHSLEIHLPLLSEIQWEAITSFTQAESLLSYDADWGNNSAWQQTPGWNQNYDYFESSQKKRTQWQQKILLKGSDWFLGGHVYGVSEETSDKSWKNSSLRGVTSSSFRNTNFALLGEKSWTHKNHRWSAAYRREWQQYKYHPLEQDKSDLVHAYNIEWQHRGPTTSFFLRWKEGFKNAGFNTDRDVLLENQFYRIETTQSYEAEWLGSFWRTVLFYQKQDNQQVRVSQQVDPQDPSSYFYWVTNAAQSEGWGFESSAAWQWQRWTWEGNFGFLHQYFKNYSFEGRSLAGRAPAHAPSWTYATSIKYRWSDRWSSTLSTQGRDAFYFSNNNEQKSHPYSLFHAGLSYHHASWDFSFWIKNLTDHPYAIRGFFFANEPPAWQNKLYTQQGAPRSLLLSATYCF